MQPSEDDLESLWDMRQAIYRVQEFIAGMSEIEYFENVLVQSAVERQLEILGEAARRVSREFQLAHPEINWRKTIGLRNVIAHQYDQLKQDELWKISQTILPDFLTLLESLLPPIEE
jgi:uncharacterized protein with HEPN domain